MPNKFPTRAQANNVLRAIGLHRCKECNRLCPLVQVSETLWFGTCPDGCQTGFVRVDHYGNVVPSQPK